MASRRLRAAAADRPDRAGRRRDRAAPVAASPGRWARPAPPSTAPAAAAAATGGPSAGVYAGRPERIEDTAALVDARRRTRRRRARRSRRGRRGRRPWPHACAPTTAASTCWCIDFWGDYAPVAFGTPFWDIPLAAARATLDGTLWPHLLTLRALVPIMRRRRPPRRRPPLVVEVAEGTGSTTAGSCSTTSAAIASPAVDLRPRRGAGAARHRRRRRVPGLHAHRARARSRSASPRRRGARRRPPIAGWAALGVAGVRRPVCRRAGRRSAGRPRAPAARSARGSWPATTAIDDLDGTRPDFAAYFREHVGELAAAGADVRPAGRWQAVREEGRA